MKRLHLFTFALGLLFYARGSVAQDAMTSQTLELEVGWSLISFQVQPADSQVSTFASKFTGLSSIWTYDSDNSLWQSYDNDGSGPGNLGAQTITIVEANKGYWVEVNQQQSVIVDGSYAAGAQSYRAGWNLVGFPGLRRGELEIHDIFSVFDENTPFVKQVWTFDSSPNVQSFVGYDVASNPPVFDLYDLAPGKGFWVYAEQAFTLTPQGLLLTAQDFDLPDGNGDLQPFAIFDSMNLDPNNTGVDTGNQDYSAYTGLEIKWRGAEDVSQDLNGNGILDDSETQTVIDFGRSQTQLSVTLVNDGNGVTGYRIREDIPWLDVANGDGSVGSEFDLATLNVVRDDLPEGDYSGDLNFFSDEGGADDRVYKVKMTVGDLSGDYKGRAVISKINGEPIDTLPSVDLFMSVSKDSQTTGSLIGVVDSGQSLLFPTDFRLSGLLFIANSNELAISGGYTLPLVAHNYPPFDNFDRESGIGGPEDFELDESVPPQRVTDIIQEGDINPFPFEMTREIFLIGRRPHYDQLEGDYFETISNVIQDQTLFLEGTFVLDRLSQDISKRDPSAFTVLKSQIVPDGSFIEIEKEVTEPLTINSIATTIKIVHPRAGDLKITLISPDPGGGATSSILYDHEEGVDVERTWTYDGGTLTGDVELTDFVGLNSFGTWKLRIDDTVALETGNFISWELQLGGVPANFILGEVVNSTNLSERIDDANVFLSGSQGTQLKVSGDGQASGQFRFEKLPQRAFAISIFKPGFHPFPFNAEDNAVAQITPSELNSVDPIQFRLTPITVGDDELDFEFYPPTGQAPLTVTTIAKVGSNKTSGITPMYRWNFQEFLSGPNTQLAASAGTIGTHTFTDPGVYHIWLEVLDVATPTFQVPGSPIMEATARTIVVLPRGDGSLAPGQYVFDPSYSGGGATMFWDVDDTDPVQLGQVTQLHGVPLNHTFADMASFDINRALTGVNQFVLSPMPGGAAQQDTKAGVFPGVNTPSGLDSGFDGRTLPVADGDFRGLKEQPLQQFEANTDDRKLRMVVNMGAPLSGKSAAGALVLRIGANP